MALDLITPVSDVHRRDLICADTNMVDPDHADHVKAGEWVGLDASGHAQEGGDDISGDSPVAGEGPFYQVFSQKGDSAAQALGKICVIMSHDYEAETDMYASGVTFSAGMALSIHQTDTGAGGTGDDTRCILTEAAASEIVVAICTMAPSATASGKLRFQRVAPHVL